MSASLDPAVVSAFTPTGRLRASINVGNPILARRDPAGGAAGVSVDLARAFARRLGVEADLTVFDTASKSVDAVSSDLADIGFFAIDPLRGAQVAFTGPYVLIEGCYLVRGDSPLRDNDEVDRPGTTVVVGKGTAYDLYLTRAIKHATLQRETSSQAVVDAFLANPGSVAAGVRQQLESDIARVGGDLRLLPGRFMEIRQAMGTPKSRGAAAAQALRDFVEEMKAGGFVAEALARHNITGAAVAPAGGWPEE